MSGRKRPLKQEDSESGDGYASKLLVPPLCQGGGEQENGDHWEEKVNHLIQDEPADSAYFVEPYDESDYFIPSPHLGFSSRHSSLQASTSSHVDSPRCTSFSHTQPSLPPFRDAVLNAFKRKAVSLSELGQAVAEYDTTPEREELMMKMLKEARLDVHLVKKLQHRARDLSQSSDPVVGELSMIVQQLADGYVGISVALDLCLNWCRDLQQANMKTNAEVARATSSKRLPDGVYLSACNLTKEWCVPLTGPFKAFNLNNLLKSWVPSTRIPRENHFVHCVDLLRSYLSQATDPPEDVQTYACRLSGKSGKCTRLVDFPETIIRMLTDFFLDAFGLCHEDMETSVEELIKKRPRYWIRLGVTDQEREAAHEERRSAKEQVSHEIRAALQRALNDIRCYERRPGIYKLVPRPKRRRDDVDVARNDSSDACYE